ncbi:MAG: Transglycosylase domain [Candidatus Paceibacter sp.]|jgi:soluble lytic murein transglycosylase-like protein|nr:Transglycosylase domain [Candidatus Paceibacter sp.]
MNKLISTLLKANAILFAFVIPFTLVYEHQERMYTRNEDLIILHAAQNEQFADIVQHHASTTRAKTRQKQAIELARLALARERGPYIDLVGTTEAQHILKLVAQCESSNNPFATNKTSSAKGLLQIIDGTWKHFRCDGDVFNAEDNMRCGMKIATQSGLHHWDESRHCWNKLLKNASQVSIR